MLLKEKKEWLTTNILYNSVVSWYRNMINSIHYNKSPLLIERLIPENQLEYQKSNHNTFLRYTIYSKKANTFSIFHNINPNWENNN